MGLGSRRGRRPGVMAWQSGGGSSSNGASDKGAALGVRVELACFSSLPRPAFGALRLGSGGLAGQESHA